MLPAIERRRHIAMAATLASLGGGGIRRAGREGSVVNESVAHWLGRIREIIWRNGRS